MRCDDAVLELSSAQGPSPELSAHLAGCADCQDAARVLSLAALPPAKEAEAAALEGLAAATLSAWQASALARAVPRPWLGQAGRLALAAGLGAAVAAGALSLRPRPAPTPATVEALAELASSDERYLLEDEVFFEVSWPDGDL
jgi:hypothetical protein